jgi:hypothetical protein
VTKREDTNPTHELPIADREAVQRAVKDSKPAPRCAICLDTGYVIHDAADAEGRLTGGKIRAYCSCGQHLEILDSTIEDMKVYLRSTGLELRISPGALMNEWTVHIHSVTEYNVGVGQDTDLVLAMRKAVQSAMRRTLKD